MHELFHLDANSGHVYKSNGHVYDRKIKIYDQYSGSIKEISAYGPLYTKVLANWVKNVGLYVVTNGIAPSNTARLF